jgi:stearoyl-CoA desaturase (delta-9 desaturase)
MNHTRIIRSLQLITHLIAIYGIWHLVINGMNNYFYISIFLYYFLGIFGFNIGYHRLLSHRSFKTSKLIEYVLSVLGTLTAMGSTIAWVAVHRQHHKYSDKPGDPHSPHLLGGLRTWLGFWGNIKISPAFIKDIRKDKFHKFLHKNYLTIHLSWLLLLFIVDPLLIVFVYAIPAVLIFHAVGAFDVLTHLHGYRTYDTADKSHNSWLANLVTPGEGWHNNHHANSGAWKSGEKWWEFDPPSWVIWLIKK